MHSSMPSSRPRQPAWAAATTVPASVAEQHRQAIGRHHGAHFALLNGEKLASAVAACSMASIDHRRAMHLPQPQRLGRQLAQFGLVGRHPRRVVADMVAQVEAGPGCRVATTGTQRLQRTWAGPPIGNRNQPP